MPSTVFISFMLIWHYRLLCGYIFILCPLSYSPALSFPQFPARSSLCSPPCHSRSFLHGHLCAPRLVIPAVSCTVISVLPALSFPRFFGRESRNYNRFSYKSFHSGFFSSISLNFHFLSHFFIFFSLSMAASGVSCVSYHTRQCTPESINHTVFVLINTFNKIRCHSNI